MRVIREKTPFRFDARLLDPGRRRPLYLDGYWQSFRYLDPVREQLLAEVRPRQPAAPHYAGLAALIERSHSVMLHVRRGDYVHSATASAAHGTLRPDEA